MINRACRRRSAAATTTTACKFFAPYVNVIKINGESPRKMALWLGEILREIRASKSYYARTRSCIFNGGLRVWAGWELTFYSFTREEPWMVWWSFIYMYILNVFRNGRSYLYYLQYVMTPLRLFVSGTTDMICDIKIRKKYLRPE